MRWGLPADGAVKIMFSSCTVHNSYRYHIILLIGLTCAGPTAIGLCGAGVSHGTCHRGADAFWGARPRLYTTTTISTVRRDSPWGYTGAWMTRHRVRSGTLCFDIGNATLLRL